MDTDEKMRNIAVFGFALREFNRRRDQIRQIISSISEQLSCPSYEVWVGQWQWPCDQSPVGICLYNTVTDPAKDHCLFCGDPDERK